MDFDEYGKSSFQTSEPTQIISKNAAGYTGWLARITGYDPTWGLARDFQKGTLLPGQRKAYALKDLVGGIYQIDTAYSGTRGGRHFLKIENGIPLEISEEEVFEGVGHG